MEVKGGNVHFLCWYPHALNWRLEREDKVVWSWFKKNRGMTWVLKEKMDGEGRRFDLICILKMYFLVCTSTPTLLRFFCNLFPFFSIYPLKITTAHISWGFPICRTLFWGLYPNWNFKSPQEWALLSSHCLDVETEAEIGESLHHGQTAGRRWLKYLLKPGCLIPEPMNPNASSIRVENLPLCPWLKPSCLEEYLRQVCWVNELMLLATVLSCLWTQGGLWWVGHCEVSTRGWPVRPK